MLKIKYQILGSTPVYNPETHENENQECFVSVVAPWTAENEELAKKTAYNGKYDIVDDGQPTPTQVPTQLDIIEAQVTYTAMMTDTLLEV